MARVVLALPLPSSTAVDRVIGQMRRKDIPIASRSAIAASSFLARQLVRARIRRWSWTRKRKPFNFKAERDNVFTLVPGEYVDGEIFVHGAYEYRLLRLLASNLHGAAFVDVGANIGNHALYLADNFDRVICFEPNPPTAARLRENIRLSGKSNVIVHELGLGERDDELPFHHHSGGNAGGGSFVRADFPVSGTLPIRVGDDVLAECGKIGLLKVDVEGFEPQVFRGLRKTIARDRPIVVFEFDGRAAGIGGWDEISGCLPDYRFAFLSGIPGSGIGKVVSALRDGVGTRLTRMDAPKHRFYETILAFPSEEEVRRFGVFQPESS